MRKRMKKWSLEKKGEGQEKKIQLINLIVIIKKWGRKKNIESYSEKTEELIKQNIIELEEESDKQK